MDTNPQHEAVEQFFPNPEGKFATTTEAIVRGASGKRYRALILGGCHQEVREGVHYDVLSILETLDEQNIQRFQKPKKGLVAA